MSFAYRLRNSQRSAQADSIRGEVRGERSATAGASILNRRGLADDIAREVAEEAGRKAGREATKKNGREAYEEASYRA